MLIQLGKLQTLTINFRQNYTSGLALVIRLTTSHAKVPGYQCRALPRTDWMRTAYLICPSGQMIGQYFNICHGRFPLKACRYQQFPQYSLHSTRHNTCKRRIVTKYRNNQPHPSSSNESCTENITGQLHCKVCSWTQTHSDLRNCSDTDGPTTVTRCTSRNSVRIWSNTYLQTTGSTWDPNPNTMEPDRPQYDRPAACVIAQQHSPANFVSKHFHS